MERLRTDVLDPLRPHLIGPERDERDVAEFERALAEIERLQAVIAASVELPTPPTGKRARVAPGALVEIRDASGDKVRVRPVHPEEATIDDERISWDSPLGSALLGAAVGDLLEVPSPRGSWSCEVVRITR
jgi:transcription elongation factor GreA